jgi:hypothetical protein
LLKLFFVCSIFLFIVGCAFIPWQLSVATNIADIVSATQTNKTMSEHALSAATDKDCQWYRLLDGEKACMTDAEELVYLKKNKCKVSAWNPMKIPYCKQLLTPITNPLTPYNNNTLLEK